MTRRRRQGVPPISFFSFQDILTSVAAIILVITLLLALELLSRSFKRPALTAIPMSLPNLELSSLNQQVESLKAAIQDVDQRIKFAAANDMQSLRGKINKVEDALKVETQKAGTLQAEKQQIEQSINDLQTQSENKQGKKTISELQQSIAASKLAIEKIKSQINIDFSRGNSRNGYLADVRGDRITLFLMANGQNIHEVRGSLLTSASEGFSSWIKKLPKDNRYVLFVIRPSGATTWNSLYKIAERDCSQFAVELAGESKGILLDGAIEE